MELTETFLMMLLVICVVAYLAQRTGMASPIAFVLAGMALASVPHFPMFEISPDVMLLLFLPPLLTEAAYFSSLRDLKANIRPISQLAVVLVLATCVAVAHAVHWFSADISLGVGFVLGAIISPPDAVAAVSVTRNLTIPKRVMTILEGESLLNDVTGLVLYKFAVAAMVTGTFSWALAGTHFVWMAFSGISIGVGVGYAYMKIFPLIRQMSVEILSTFLVPYAIYIMAEAVDGSGVMAVVAGGLTMGWYAPKHFSPAFRIPAEAVWRMVIFVLNGLVFLLIGLHFTGLLQRLHNYPLLTLGKMAAAVSFIAIAVRFVWVYLAAYGWRFLSPTYRKRDPYPAWQNVFIIAWTGMRGVVSLATALALPLTVASGAAFPDRDLIIFLAFSVILVTLVLQGLTLPWLVKKLTLFYDAGILQEQWQARKDAAEAAMRRLEEFRKDGKIQSAALDRIISHYCDRIESLGDGPNTPINLTEPPTAQNHPLIVTESHIWKEVLEAERQTVITMRQNFKISDDVMHEILRDIDLLHNRFANIA